MKKYVLFSFFDYYPSGGMFDLDDSYDTLDEAKDAIEQNKIKSFCPKDNFQVVDRDTWVIVHDDHGMED